MKADKTIFHRQVAEELLARYQSNSQPEGWREIVAWHWEQAGAYAEAADVAIERAETYVAKLAFGAARHWAEHILELLERLDPLERRMYELRTYALALAVLEFGGQYR